MNQIQHLKSLVLSDYSIILDDILPHRPDTESCRLRPYLSTKARGYESHENFSPSNSTSGNGQRVIMTLESILI